MKTLRAFGTVAVAVLIAATVGMGVASADTITYTLGVPNSGLSQGGLNPPPYATVLVDLTSSTTATITFTGIDNGTETYLMDLAAVNVNASTFTMGTVTATNTISGFSVGTFVTDTSPPAMHPFQEDGFGKFNAEADETGGFTNSAQTISFTITDTSGTWASAANVLVANADGFLAAAHIFVCVDPCNVQEGARTTGFAGNGTVPEPSSLSLLLFGVALFGFALYMRRKGEFGYPPSV